MVIYTVSEIYEEYNETIVTLRLPKKYYKTAYAVSHLLGFKSFDEYVSDAVIQYVFIEIDVIETQELLEEWLTGENKWQNRLYFCC